MLITSPDPQPRAPTQCTFCSEPLRTIEGRVQSWRSRSGQCFCSEFCADDAEEAAFQSRRKTG
jgi:hypothetical protein